MNGLSICERSRTRKWIATRRGLLENAAAERALNQYRCAFREDVREIDVYKELVSFRELPKILRRIVTRRRRYRVRRLRITRIASGRSVQRPQTNTLGWYRQYCDVHQREGSSGTSAALFRCRRLACPNRNRAARGVRMPFAGPLDANAALRAALTCSFGVEP
jgi:hypothetical protein